MASNRYIEPEYTGPALDKHDKQYIGVGFGLAVLTAIEVALYGVEKSGNISGGANTWSLLILAFIKFAIVAGFFMHLKLDNPIFKRLFVMGAILAGFCYVAVLTLFGVFDRAWISWIAYVGFAIVAAIIGFRGKSGDDHDHDSDHDHAGHDHAGHDHDHAEAHAH
jgi:cytochrome c oxidase subunit IV